MIRWRQMYLRAFAAVVAGTGLFFSLFVIIVMTPTCSPHAFWVLIVPLGLIIYGSHNLDKVDQFLTVTHEGWR